MKKLTKKHIVILLLIFLLIIWYIDIDNIKVDRYNFLQLEKIKNTLDELDRNSYKFDNVKEFNIKFNQDIKPLKNCYFLSERNWYFENNNWWWWYIFWFKLESLLYKLIYFDKYYIYPKYDLPSATICDWTCRDVNFPWFLETISNSCKE